MKRVLIALGGNALLRTDEEQTYSNQYKNISNAARHIAGLIRKNKSMKLIITHGNGPQVGDEFLRNLFAANKVKSLPFHIINAETQAFIGSMLETALLYQFAQLGIERDISVVLTHTIVGSNDAAFSKPTKPIGPLYTTRQLEQELRRERFSYSRFGNKYRRVIASPAPIEVVEHDQIQRLFDSGTIVIAGGGGGIPVYRSKGIKYAPPSVIDKDFTSRLIANSIFAEQMVILTDIDYVYRDLNDKSTRIGRASISGLEKMIPNFGEGTMKPKVKACIDFIRHGGTIANIGLLEHIDEVIEGRSGTIITK
ncbi:MAG: carbamate kinase [Candidatus Micrarchaeia archaeon]